VYPSIRVRTAPPVSVRIRVRVRVSFTEVNVLNVEPYIVEVNILNVSHDLNY